MTGRFFSVRLTFALSAFVLAACFLQVGCASNAPAANVTLPSYEWISPQQGASLANQRATSLDTVFAAGDLLLDIPQHTDANGKAVKASNIKLKVAVIVMGPEHLRFRAWQKKKPVLDITIIGKELWMWTAEKTSPLPVSNARLRQLPAMLRGTLPAQTSVVSERPTWVTLGGGSGADKSVHYLMHKPTLTVRRYTILGSDQKVHEAVNMENYEVIDLYPWPRRVIASSDEGSMQIDFTAVDLNGRLPQNAFEPLPQAVKQAD